MRSRGLCVCAAMAAVLAVAQPSLAGRVGVTRLASAARSGVGNDASIAASMSAGGTYVAFASAADNLVPGDTNLSDDVFVKDLDTDGVVRVSVSTAGVEANASSSDPAISYEGRYVVFASDASNLVPADGNGRTDVFLHDRDADADQIFDEPGATTTYRLSQNLLLGEPDGMSYDASITEYGSRITFVSSATNLIADDRNAKLDVFVVDLDFGEEGGIDAVHEPVLISRPLSTLGNDHSFGPAMAGDGSAVAFVSDATNLVTGDTNSASDIYLWTSATDAVSRVSEGPFETEPNGASVQPAMSTEGRYVAFSSDADNLAAGVVDANQMSDIYVRDLLRGVTQLVSAKEDGSAATGVSGWPAIFYGRASFREYAYRLYDLGLPDPVTDPIYQLADATPTVMVAFQSTASDLIDPATLGAVPSYARELAFEGDTNGVQDVFVREVVTGRTVRISTGSAGEQGAYPSSLPSPSLDGKRIAFLTTSRFEVSDTNDEMDVYVTDLSACHSGAEENGPVTSETHELEPLAVGVEGMMHEGGCRAGREGL